MKYLALIILLAVAACSQAPVDNTPVLQSESDVNITGNSSIQIGQNLEVYIEADSIIRIPQATYYTKAGPWQVFKKQGNNWEEIIFYTNCFNSCDKVCTEQVTCTTGGPYPGCSRVREKETSLKWDLRKLTDSTQLCGAVEYSCKEAEFIEPGEYKVVFSYRDDCASGITWTLEESPIYTKEWYFTVLA